jgi:hypothetical protein
MIFTENLRVETCGFDSYESDYMPKCQPLNQRPIQACPVKLLNELSRFLSNSGSRMSDDLPMKKEPH